MAEALQRQVQWQPPATAISVSNQVQRSAAAAATAFSLNGMENRNHDFGLSKRQVIART
jgi:hypothetical protein